MTESRGWLTRRRGNGETHRWPHLRRGQRHRRVPSDDTHLPIPFSRPLPRSSYDCVGNGGRRRGRCGTPTTASLHCSTQARYELHEATMELTKQRKEDENGSVVVGHGELHSGEAWPWRWRRKNGHWSSPKARMARLDGQRGKGGHGGAMAELEVALLRRRWS